MEKTSLISMLMLCISFLANAQTAYYDDAVQGTGSHQHNYVGAGWVHGTNTPNFSLGTLSFTSVAGSEVTFPFTGVKIEWLTEKKNWHGIVAVSIDGGTETMIDLYSHDEIHTTVYSSDVLPLGTHTIKLRATGLKNPVSTGYYAIHDGFKVFTSLENDPLTSTAVGYNALNTNAGNWNTAFGYNTLRNTAGRANTAVGAYALQNSSGARNTAVGFGALPHGSPASDNTAVGYNALWSAGAGSLPNAIPQPPTSYLGSNNTGVGANAGPAKTLVDGITGVTNSTALGSNAFIMASHQVRIGDADVTSIGGKVSWSTLSDGRFKRDLQEDVSGLEFVNKLRPVSYTVDKVALQKFLGVPDSLQTKVEVQQDPLRQTGFVAQEVDKLLKKSNYVFSGIDAPKNENDPYTIRYAEFVVPLVKAVQELSAQNEEQQKQIAQLLQRFDDKEKEESGMTPSGISLLQNNPNPFSVNTEIKMVLPETVGSANIMVYNLEGKQLKQFQVKGRGNVSTTIPGNELNAGMYIYALIVDGKVVDTKRMILTK